MGCAVGKDPNFDATVDDEDFDPRLLQESWYRVVRGREGRKPTTATARRTLTKRSTRGGGGRGTNSNFMRGRDDRDWEKLLPKLMEGFQRGLERRGGPKSKRSKMSSNKWKGRPFGEEALAGITALDLLVRSADDPERLAAVCSQLGRGLAEGDHHGHVGRNHHNHHLAVDTIRDNLDAIKMAVMFLLGSKLKSREFHDPVKRTWLTFIDRCCECILRSHETAVAPSMTTTDGDVGYFDTFSDAAKKFVRENLWLILTVGYQFGAYLWNRNSQRPLSTANENRGPTSPVDEEQRPFLPANGPDHLGTKVWNNSVGRPTSAAVENHGPSGRVAALPPRPNRTICLQLSRSDLP